jgi:uncharacterized protein
MTQITWESHPSPMKLEVLGVEDWPIWKSEVDRFPWTYDATEVCYILEGKVVVTPEGGEPVELNAGDLVTFEKGLKCYWEVHSQIEKHYMFKK